MTEEQIIDFREEFKAVVYQYSKIQDSNKRLRSLHAWDKNGSHEKAIHKELNIKKEHQELLKSMLRGIDYEDWRQLSIKLSRLTSKLKTAITNKEKCELEISKINFYP